MRLGKLAFQFPVFLAPMAGVTDLPFRLLCRVQGCDMTYTEMISAKGLLYAGERTRALLSTAQAERPCGVQLFGSDPEILADMAKKVISEQGEEIALIDINMGCPAPKITGNGEGSALMKNIPLAGRIIEAVAKAAFPVPVTVKFRKGWDETCINAVPFAKMAEAAGAAAVAVHGRTREQGYSGRADWDIIAEVKAAVSIPVLGNGDVFTGADAVNIKAHTGCDGILIGRGAQGNPWIFREVKAALNGQPYTPPTWGERITMAIAHGRMQQQYKGDHGVIEMRKHLSWYLKGVQGAAGLRAEINRCTTLSKMEEVLLCCIQKQ